MTEAEWLKGNVPDPMLAFLGDDLSERKLRLFGAACCRRVWRSLGHEQLESQHEHYRRAYENLRNCVRLAEQYVDGETTKAEMENAAADFHACEKSDEGLEYAFAACAGNREALLTVHQLVIDFLLLGVYNVLPETDDGQIISRLIRAAIDKESGPQAALLRDVVGNPFRPVDVDPQWLTDTVTALAKANYQKRQLPAGTLDRDHLAVLADALEEAGCSDQVILDHCRGPGPHVRGCWVLDLLTGRK